jgi:hypothetical protein
MQEDHDEIMELKHDPVPGYRPIFYVAITAGLVYLGVIFFNTM